MEAYLDNAATTKAFPEVAELVTKVMCEDYGNPSSLHERCRGGKVYPRSGRRDRGDVKM